MLGSQLELCENFFLIGDFFVDQIIPFCQMYSCKNIVKDKTWFKNSVNPTSIDLIITNTFKDQILFKSLRYSKLGYLIIIKWV